MRAPSSGSRSLTTISRSTGRRFGASPQGAGCGFQQRTCTTRIPERVERSRATDSNGLAGGNCLEEAVLQGLLELVERDAVSLWWYNRARVPAVRLSAAIHPFVLDALDLYEGLGRAVWALDLTTDLGIPTVAALSARADEGPEDITFGFGCHPDPAIAIRRALTELHQMLPAVLRSEEERERQLLPDFEDAIRWWRTARVADHPYLVPGSGVVSGRWRSGPTAPASDLLEVLRRCIAKVESAELEVLVHDLSRADTGFHVAKVVVPGLRHFWRRTGPGRLYDVPVALGWIDAPLPESELNPVSMFV